MPAKGIYETSVRLAESVGSVDLVHLHRTALTRVLRRDPSRIDDRREALRFLRSAEEYAVKMDIRCLLAEVLNSRAEMQLAYNVDLAAQYASQAL